jgi:dTDP-glucose 4,6-dehydratase
MRILITGGAGFIGANFAHLIARKYPEYEIVIIDKLNQQGRRENLKDIEDTIEFHKFDLIEFDKLSAIFEEKQIDMVAHFAAETNVDRSIENPMEFVNSNIIATQNLLSLSQKHGISRFHHVSTDEVFGELPLDPTVKFNEQTAYDPRSPYSATKAGSDHLVRAAHATYGLPITISNCSNNYGPYQVPENIIPLFALFALHDRDLTIYGDGKSVRDYLFVEDHCRAIDLIMHKGVAGETYCVGGGAEKNGVEIADAVLAAVPETKSVKKFVTDRPGHDLRYAIDYSKLRDELGYQPSVTFEEGLKKTVDWYRQNEWWWKPIINDLYVPDFLKQGAKNGTN